VKCIFLKCLLNHPKKKKKKADKIVTLKSHLEDLIKKNQRTMWIVDKAQERVNEIEEKIRKSKNLMELMKLDGKILVFSWIFFF
jgi:predicted  nucleic acid-binding Zn-ribbon protein